MANSQLKCLEEDEAYVEVTESCPDFYYSEGQRLALEALLSSGSEAFQDCLKKDRLRHFLSEEEVTRLVDLVQDYQPGEVELEEDPELAEDLSLSYWPGKTDTPTPVLELGWPEQGLWKGITRAEVFTQPPAENAPPIKEVVRRTIQNATKVIAVVMDVFTDPDIFLDLYDATSRRQIPVYIILSHLHLPAFLSMVGKTSVNIRYTANMRVRVLSGCTFHTRHLKQVTGTLKEKFILVDGESVITGTYSFTWMDCRLERNLITLLTGEITDSFDKEFRTLFAASKPIHRSELLKDANADVRWKPPPVLRLEVPVTDEEPTEPLAKAAVPNTLPTLPLAPEVYANGYSSPLRFDTAGTVQPTDPTLKPFANLKEGTPHSKGMHKIAERRTVEPQMDNGLGKRDGVSRLPSTHQDTSLTPKDVVNVPDHSIRYRLAACRNFEGPTERLRAGQDPQSALSDILKQVQRNRLSVAKTVGTRPSKSLWDLSRLSQMSGSSVGSGAGQAPLDLGEEARGKSRYATKATPAMLLMRQRAHPNEENRPREQPLYYNTGYKSSNAYSPLRLQGQLLHGLPSATLARPWISPGQHIRSNHY
ncbi:protein FAM83E [Ambystoma mexicanum]|uniref:protein FAM83E n=1 Tax=Ambystoma mexicanum TaxID=8296 RepID=UPI0037E9853C